jgi:hypothetical protein
MIAPIRMRSRKPDAQAQPMTFIARDVLAGRRATIGKRPADAANAFRQAADMQDGADFSAVYDPPAWYYPVRRDYARAPLATGDKMASRP